MTLDELHESLGKRKSGVTSDYVEDLEKSGFLLRHHTWNPRTGQQSNRYKVRIIDNYVRFYLKAIRPAADRIKSGLNTLPANLHGVMGLQFENPVLKNKQLMLGELGGSPCLQRSNMDPINSICFGKSTNGTSEGLPLATHAPGYRALVQSGHADAQNHM